MIGINKDLPAVELPPEAWTDGQNIRFRNGKVERSLGHSQVFGTPAAAPVWVMAVPTSVEFYWIYANATKLYATDGNTHTDVSQAGDYTTLNSDDLWSGGILGGLPIITNNIELPQFWSPGLSNLFADLTNWPASTQCRDIKPFKNFLIALNVTKSGTLHPHMVKWSHPADPGSVPSSWDETDATKDAGEKELEDIDAGFIVEGWQLRDTFVVYKENSTWGLQFIGGVNIFRFFPIFLTTGILTKHCSAVVQNGELHCVATGDALILHDGRNVIKSLDKRWRKYINDNINLNQYQRAYLVPDHANREVWFCFPTGGNTWPDLALIWNWKDDTVGVRDLSADISFIASGIVPTDVSNLTWDSDSEAWDDDASIWDLRPFGNLTLSLLMADPTNTKMYLAEDTNAFDGTEFSCYIERKGLSVAGVDREGNPKADPVSMKLVKRLYFRGAVGTFDVKVGYQQKEGDSITYSAAQTFVAGTTEYLDFTVSGRLLVVRVQDPTSPSLWAFAGYDMGVEVLGAL
tara:strand:+ start:3892 stop:5445 length:1554 start_codon:yes stop_codon:yes gene_type:complete